MKILYTTLLLTLGFSGLSQDLIVTDQYDSIPAKRVSFDNDSSIHYKPMTEKNKYQGFLKKGYYIEVVPDYYTSRKWKNTPNNSSMYFSAGAGYGYMLTNPPAEMIDVESSFFYDLNNGIAWSLSFHKFLTFGDFYKNPNGEYSSFAIGFSFDHFSSRAGQNSNETGLHSFTRRMRSSSVVFSYVNKNLSKTVFHIAPGISRNKSVGYNNQEELRAEVRMFKLGIGANHRLIGLGSDFALYLKGEILFFGYRKGNINFYPWDGYEQYGDLWEIITPIQRNADQLQVDLGFNFGIQLIYFR